MDAAQIQYAPVDPQEKQRLRARRLFQRFVPLLILLAMSPVLWRCGTIAWRRSQILVWQRKAMNYTQPPGRIVFAGSSYDVISREWLEFSSAYSPPGRNIAPMLFLHELRNGKGESRLVAIEDSPTLAWVTVVAPGSMIREPKEVYDAQRVLINFSEAGDKKRTRFVVYAGQLDPRDASHFTIDCDIGDKVFTIDGYLGDDDAVTFSTHEK